MMIYNSGFSTVTAMSDDKYLYNYDGYGFDEFDSDGEVVVKQTPKIPVTEIQYLSLQDDEILVIKYDPEQTNQNEIEMWSKAMRNYLKNMISEDASKRFIMLPKDWELTKMRMESKPVEHPLYEEKVIKTED